MKKIEEIRKWIAVCDEAGIGHEIPEQVRLLDADAMLLEGQIMHLQFAALTTPVPPQQER